MLALGPGRAVLIQACLNAGTTRAEHPAVPLTPAELAAEARDLATYDVIRAAAGMGADVRIGLEDTTVLPDGTTAAGNGDLVAAAVRLVRAG